MSITAWRTFVSVCQQGSLSTAADKLGYTQSAVSRQVATLEREVGRTLLERTVRGTKPTAAGSAFLRHAVMVVNSAERARRAARDVGRDTGALPLIIGATPSLAAGVVPTAMRDVLDTTGTFPWTLVPALSPESHARIRAGELDIALVTDAPPGLPDDSQLSRVLLGQDEMVVVVPATHRAACETHVHIADFAEESWAEDNEGSATILRHHATRAGVVARIDHTAADLPGKVALVAAGHAVALVPGAMAATLRPDVRVVRLNGAPTRGIYAVLPRETPHPAVDPLLTELTTLLSSNDP